MRRKAERIINAEPALESPPTRVSSNGKLPDWRDFEENGCGSSLTFTRFVLAGS
jgi:hypothetical protein